MDQAEPKPFITRLLIDLAIMVVIGVVLGLIGPLGSFNDPLAYRMVVWIAFALLGYALYAPIDTIAVKLAPVLQLPVWPLRIAGVLLSSIPMAVIVYLIPRDRIYWTWPGLENALTHYVYVVMIGGAITAVNTLIQRPQTRSLFAAPGIATDGSAKDLTAHNPTPAASPYLAGKPNPLLDQLPAELGSDVIALEMEDHYVRVHTALGSELVLMRLRDAMVHVADIEGQQVHRSWWVARGAVEDVEREGRNVRLKLARDVEAPVSRANVSVLKDAGWF